MPFRALKVAKNNNRIRHWIRKRKSEGDLLCPKEGELLLLKWVYPERGSDLSSGSVYTSGVSVTGYGTPYRSETLRGKRHHFWVRVSQETASSYQKIIPSGECAASSQAGYYPLSETISSVFLLAVLAKQGYQLRIDQTESEESYTEVSRRKGSGPEKATCESLNQGAKLAAFMAQTKPICPADLGCITSDEVVPYEALGAA
ncbi:hypothetical protein ACFE04_011454 [Oxalis oulophora]